MTHHVHYFAYGSNMAVERLTSRVSSASKVCVAQLQGHVLRFHKVSDNDGSAKCDVARTENPEDTVHGVLFRVTRVDLEILDRYEGLGYGYERKSLTVIAESGEAFDAETYVATSIDPTLRPYAWYKEHVLRGAQASGLPEHYIAMIESVECDEDQDWARHVRELAIYR